MEQLVSHIFIMGRRMREEMRRNATKNDCSMLHFETLMFIRDARKPLMRDIAEYFMITPPAATLLIEGLSEQKFITRIVDSNDRRAVRLSLAPRGKRMIEHGLREKMKKIKEVFSVLTPQERKELIRIIAKVNQK
jgi:DNA-binding MarR family transcriptional regulator